MRGLIRRLRTNELAAAAAEFALVLPVALLFLLGIIDVGRFMWGVSKAEKATQIGARRLAVTDPIASGYASYSFATSCGIPSGDPIPDAMVPEMTCSSSSGTASCSIDTGTTCPSFPTTINSTAFTDLVNHMRTVYPSLGPDNVEVAYTRSGLGYAGNPNGPDVSPIVTVRLKGLPFNPLFLGTIPTFAIPGTSYSLTLEDGAGNFSN